MGIVAYAKARLCWRKESTRAFVRTVRLPIHAKAPNVRDEFEGLGDSNREHPSAITTTTLGLSRQSASAPDVNYCCISWDARWRSRSYRELDGGTPVQSLKPHGISIPNVTMGTSNPVPSQLSVMLPHWNDHRSKASCTGFSISHYNPFDRSSYPASPNVYSGALNLDGRNGACSRNEMNDAGARIAKGNALVGLFQPQVVAYRCAFSRQTAQQCDTNFFSGTPHPGYDPRLAARRSSCWTI